ncbi:DUF445 domain-containing protein [Nocardia sp. NPDC059228]|uniref:DUF445 domain-containing protein n=1 Tax=Nocardia sp. NPDC059228 TaxID=3346777 RepID=UPI0036773677
MTFLTDIGHDLAEHWPLYASMPFITALIGYVTKLVAVEMMFRPLEFVGIPPFLGWQGIVPRYADRMANSAVSLLMKGLLDPQEVVDQIDVDALLEQLRDPMREMVERITRELMQSLAPTIWVALPEVAQNLVIGRVETAIPATLAQFKDDLKTNVDTVVDIRTLAVDALTRDKALTVKMIRTIGRNEMQFIVRMGVPFGFGLGIVQAVTWALTHSTWIMPLFGGFTGLFTDWLALQMIFRPRRPRRFLGIIKWQGLFHKRRAEVTRDYSLLIADEILTPANLLEGLLTGPKSDRFLWMIDHEIQRAIDSSAGIARPVVTFAIGSDQYTAVKHDVATRVIATMRDRADEFGDLAANAMNMPDLLRGKMQLMTDDEFEGLLRPAFKQDEWKLVVVGALLGFLIGELQVHLLLQ